MAKAGKDDPLARQMRAAREWAGMSRAQVANALGVDPLTIGRWERGEWVSRPPSLAHQREFARATGAPEWFVISGFGGAASLADDALDALAESNRRAPDPSTPAKRPQQ